MVKFNCPALGHGCINGTNRGLCRPTQRILQAHQTNRPGDERVVTDGTDRLRAAMTVNVTSIDGKPVVPPATPPNGATGKGNLGQSPGRRSGGGSQ
jgi:hypothetical protein